MLDARGFISSRSTVCKGALELMDPDHGSDDVLERSLRIVERNPQYGRVTLREQTPKELSATRRICAGAIEHHDEPWFWYG